METKNPKTYSYMVNFLGLTNITKLDASNAIENARGVMLRIRRERKVLIKNFLLG